MKTTCTTCTESHEIKDMIFRRDTDALIKKVRELRERWLNDDSDYYEAILDGSWPQAVPILEAALENARLKKETKEVTKKDFYIIVNAVKHPILKAEGKLTYGNIVQMADPKLMGKESLSVTYRKGPPSKPEGILIYNQIVDIKDGMIFNVADTSNA